VTRDIATLESKAAYYQGLQELTKAEVYALQEQLALFQKENDDLKIQVGLL